MQKMKVNLAVFLSLIFLCLASGAFGKAATIDWETLSELDFQTGKMTKGLEKLDGESVRIPGYIVPLEGDDGEITEFFLVPYFGACIHVPPPPPNQIVHVIMNKGFPGEIAFYPVWVTGVLNVATIQNDLAEASFSMNGFQVVEYEY